MSILAAFQPRYGVGAVISTTTSSSSTLFDNMATQSGGGSKSAVITNQDDTDGVYFRIGVGTQTATTAGYYLPPLAQVCVAKGEYDNHIGLIAVAGTPAVHVIVGEGF